MTRTALVTITQMKPLRVTFTLPERDLDQLRDALRATRRPRSTCSPRVPAEARAAATSNFIDSTVDITSGTITAKAEFPNDELELWPGQYFDVEIELGRQDRDQHHPDRRGAGRPGRLVRLRGGAGQQVETAPGHRRSAPRRHERRRQRPQGRRARRGRRPAPTGARHAVAPEAAATELGQAARRERRMNISEFCIRRPVATMLLSVGAGRRRHLRLSATCRWRPCRASTSRSSTSRPQLPGASPDTMANVGRDAADQAVLDHRRHRARSAPPARRARPRSPSSSTSTATSTPPRPTCRRRSPARSASCPTR